MIVTASTCSPRPSGLNQIGEKQDLGRAHTNAVDEPAVCLLIYAILNPDIGSDSCVCFLVQLLVEHAF